MTRLSRNEAGPRRPGPNGETIRADELLPWAALHSRLGWGARALADAQARGLRVLAFAKRKYVLGRDLIGFLESIHGQQQPSDRGEPIEQLFTETTNT